jgi:hypothetical protein
MQHFIEIRELVQDCQRMRSLYALGRKSPQTVADDVAAM